MAATSVRRTGAGQIRAGVIDIGSNSVRLVAFELRHGLALPLFNEKAICRLGAGLSETGRLADDSVALALASLRRFRLLAGALELGHLFILATSAVRDADNGGAFVTSTEEIFDTPVQVLSGEEEARYAGLGVVAGLPDADGMAGDLGGGSLELTELMDGRIGGTVSLPLGPLRLAGLDDGDMEAAHSAIDRHLAAVPWLAGLEGRTFFAVGGAWRALAAVRMAKSDYPLRILHGYAFSREDAETLIKQVVKTPPASLGRLPGVSKQRAGTLPYAALLLGRVLAAGRPAQVCFSAHGLREGYLHHHLGLGAECGALEVAVGWLARSSEVPPGFRDLLMDWSEPLFAGDGSAQRRLRAAACGLSNLAWYEHPDYRARQAFEAVLRANSLPLGHHERGFLALVTLHRYGSAKQAPEAQTVEAIIPQRLARQARVLGLAIRIAYRISGGSERLLRAAHLRVEGGELRLRLPPELDAGEAIARDHANLAKAAGLSATSALAG